ncbi:MAG: glucan biosynthesis protein [Proteobacteria bacterium]|nr:glucan biosynthesis protein [Pseudomonadota bacterium]
MPSSPNHGDKREAAGRRLLLYLQLFPLPVEHSLELALEVLRELPEDADPAEAVARLQARLRELKPQPFPAVRPALRRGPMPSQYLGRARRGDKHAKARSASRRSQFLLLAFLAALLVLTVQLSSWVPQTKQPAQQTLESQYLTSLEPAQKQRRPAGIAVSTRTATDKAGRRRFVIDFEGQALSLLQATTKLEAVVTCSPGASITEQSVIKNERTGGWGLTFLVKADPPSTLESLLPGDPPPVELRAFLRFNQIVLTETWNYAFKP